jgi:hypothetical protein
MYYTPSIILLAGVENSRTALLISMGPAAVNAAGEAHHLICWLTAAVFTVSLWVFSQVAVHVQSSVIKQYTL